MKYETKRSTLKWITDTYAKGEIITIRTIQRPQQRITWTTKGEKSSGSETAFNRKSNEFLELTFNGGSELSPFNLVNFRLLKTKIETEITSLKKDFESKKQYNDEDIEEITIKKTENRINILTKLLDNLKTQSKNKEPKFVLMDGQNRLEYALKPFFKDGLEFKGNMLRNSTRTPLGITFVEEDGVTTKNILECKFNQLTEEQQEELYNIPVLLNIGIAGDINDFTDTIVRLNDGVPWTSFEKFAIKWTPIVDRLHDTAVMQPIHNLFKSIKEMKSSYDLAKRGHQKFILETVYWFDKGAYSDAKSLDNYTNMDVKNDESKLEAYNKMERYLLTIADAMGTNIEEKDLGKFFNLQAVRSLCLLMYIMEGHKILGIHATDIKERLIKNRVFVKSDDGDGDVKMGKYVLKIPKGNNGTSLINPRQFILAFITWHAKMASMKLNPDDFQENPDGKGAKNSDNKKVGREPKQGTYADSLYTPSKIEQRALTVTDFIIKEVPKLIEDNVLCLIADRYGVDLLEELEKAKYQDVYASEDDGLTDLDIFDAADLHIDHVVPISKGGSDSIDNKVVTRASTNLRKASNM